MPFSSSALQTLLTQFQTHYPMGCLLSELLTVHNGVYAVRAVVQIGNTILATGMAAAPDLEAAEDRAKWRALEALPMRSNFSSEAIASRILDQPILPTSPPPSTWATGQYEPISTPQSSSDLSAPLPRREVSPTANTSSPPEIASSTTPPTSSWTPPAQPAAMGSTVVNSVVADFYSHINADEDEIPTSLNATSSPATAWEDEASGSQFAPKVAAPSSASKPRRKATSTPEPTGSSASVDLSDVIAQTDVELARLGWNKTQGREHLKQTYGKRSRQELDETELYDFLNYLQSQ